MREKPTPDTSKITHKGTVGAQQTSSQGEQRLHHQRDMTITHTLFLNPIVDPLSEVGGQLLGHTLHAELPDTIPVGAHDRSHIADPV